MQWTMILSSDRNNVLREIRTKMITLMRTILDDETNDLREDLTGMRRRHLKITTTMTHSGSTGGVRPEELVEIMIRHREKNLMMTLPVEDGRLEDPIEMTTMMKTMTLTELEGSDLNKKMTGTMIMITTEDTEIATTTTIVEETVEVAVHTEVIAGETVKMMIGETIAEIIGETNIEMNAGMIDGVNAEIIEEMIIEMTGERTAKKIVEMSVGIIEKNQHHPFQKMAMRKNDLIKIIKEMHLQRHQSKGEKMVNHRKWFLEVRISPWSHPCGSILSIRMLCGINTSSNLLLLTYPEAKTVLENMVLSLLKTAFFQFRRV
mmetsp:Transcript_9732/g.21678  ORF Transcript_9732/g.21678 Transcript_9732/m.21678 type:complete len:319 (-) Transcript_9732:2197-3153(-)